MNEKKRRASARFGIERQVVAFSTADSWARVPHVSYAYEADADSLLAYHRELSERLRKAGGKPEKITLNTLLMPSFLRLAFVILFCQHAYID